MFQHLIGGCPLYRAMASVRRNQPVFVMRQIAEVISAEGSRRHGWTAQEMQKV